MVLVGCENGENTHTINEKVGVRYTHTRLTARKETIF